MTNRIPERNLCAKSQLMIFGQPSTKCFNHTKNEESANWANNTKSCSLWYKIKKLYQICSNAIE